MKKETIGILICTLLISVAIAPAINALDNEINEVNNVKEPTETFGLADTGSWEGIINDIITRFEAAETQESKIDILREIPVVMDMYGLLPEDMSVEETQELIVSSYLETIASDSFQSDKQSSVAGDSSLAVSKSVFPSALPQLQVSESNRINSIKLNPPQPAEWPPESKCVSFGFGRISNPKREQGGWYYEWHFNCENVICCIEGEYGGCDMHHYTDGELAYIIGDPTIVTNKFMFDPFPFIFFWIVE